MKVTVILPARNEEEAIGKVLDELHFAQAYSYRASLEIEALVIDASSDNTASIARSKGAKVIQQISRGKGNAFKECLPYLEDSYIVLMADADHTYPVFGPVLMVLNKLIVEDYDVAIGYRKWREIGAMPNLNLFGNWFLSALTTLLYGYYVRDICSGLWGFKKEVLDKFNITSEGFTLEADLFVNARRNHCKIAQFLIRYRTRIGKSQAKFKPVVDWFKILKFLIIRRF